MVLYGGQEEVSERGLMRRARFLGAGQIRVEETARPEPGPGEVLVRVEACALCGSDRGAWEQGSSVTPGHETAGTVVDRGANVTIPIGATGAIFLVAFCDRCRLCRAGSRGACLHKEAMLGFTRDGGFAEYLIAPERCFLPLDPRLDVDAAVMLLDVVGTSMHALRRAGVCGSLPEAALVMGTGPVGLGCILALHAIGVPKVVAVDTMQFRVTMASRCGAHAIRGGEEVVDGVRALLPDGPPLVIEASGNPSAQRQALDLLAPGGRMVVVGHSRVPLELWTSRDLIQEERTILGSEYFDSREFEENQRLILSGRLAPTQIITHRMPLTEIEAAYHLFWQGVTGKVLIYPQRP